MNPSEILIADDNEGVRRVLALAMARAEYDGIGCGATDRLTKPFNLPELHRRVARLLEDAA